MRTTLCVRFKSEVVACGVVYAAARRFQVPLPENPPWWKAFDADKSGIDEVCRVLAHLYSLPKAQYIPVCKDGDSFTFSSNKWNSQSQPVSKVILIFSSASPQILRFIQSWGLTIYSSPICAVTHLSACCIMLLQLLLCFSSKAQLQDEENLLYTDLDILLLMWCSIVIVGL